MEDYLRKLARSNRWQFLYSKGKQFSGIKMFMNDFNFSNKQITFLYWLSVYNLLYQDLATKEDFLTADAIEDDIECDAYLYFREHRDKKKEQKLKEKKNVSNTLGIPSLVRRD